MPGYYTKVDLVNNFYWKIILKKKQDQAERFRFSA